MNALPKRWIMFACALLVLGCGPNEEEDANQMTSEPAFTRIKVDGYDRVRDARFSPDGERLVLVAESGQDDVVVLTTDLSGGDPTVLVDEGLSYLSSAVWSGDGQQIYYSGDGGIWRIAVGGGEPENVVDAFAVLSMDVARDGSRIAWSENGPNKVNVAPLDTIPATNDTITYGPAGFNPRFSPDSSRIIFTQYFEDDAVYKLSPADLSGEPEDVDGLADYLSNAAWQSDDVLLMFDDNKIVQRFLTTGEVVELGEGFAGTGLDVSADGSQFLHGSNGQPSIKLYPLD